MQAKSGRGGASPETGTRRRRDLCGAAEPEQQMRCEPLEHQPIALGAEVIVPRYEVPRVPVRMGLCGIEEKREQIYEKLAIAHAEVAIHIDLAVGAVIVGDLRWTGKDRN